MISTLLRPLTHTLALALVLAHTILDTPLPKLPDWDKTNNPTHNPHP